MKTTDVLIIVAGLSIAASVYVYLKKRKATVLSSGKIYTADPAYDYAGH